MEQIVRVRETRPDGTALVMHTRQSACSGDCHKCSGCGAAQEVMLFEASNPIGARPGQLVVVRSETAPVMRAVGIFYVLPLVLFFLGYWLGHVLWQQGALIACLAFALGIALTVLYDRTVAGKDKQSYTITGFPGDTLLESVKKGDNTID